MTFFVFPRVQWLHMTGEVDNLEDFRVKFSQDFTCQKLSKSANFWRVTWRTWCMYDMYVDDISRHLALHIQLQKECEGVNTARPFLQFSASVSRKECVYFCHDQRDQLYDCNRISNWLGQRVLTWLWNFTRRARRRQLDARRGRWGEVRWLFVNWISNETQRAAGRGWAEN